MEKLSCPTLLLFWTYFEKMGLIRRSHQRCSIAKGVPRNFANFTAKDLCQSLFSWKRDSGTGLFLWKFYGIPTHNCFWLFLSQSLLSLEKLCKNFPKWVDEVCSIWGSNDIIQPLLQMLNNCWCQQNQEKFPG